MEVQKVLSNEESTPITFEFYSHGACGTDNATTSYSRHACLVHQVLIQRHALFPVAESFKETTVTMYTLLPRHTVSSYDYRGIWIRSGSRAWIRMKAGEEVKRGGIRNSRGQFFGPMTRAEGCIEGSTIFIFAISRTMVNRPSLHPAKKRKESRAGYRLSVTILDFARVVFRKGGEESSLAAVETNFPSLRGTNKEIQLQNRPFRRRFCRTVCVWTLSYRVYIYIWKIKRHELSIGINTSMGGWFSSILFEFRISFFFEHAFSQLRRG